MLKVSEALTATMSLLRRVDRLVPLLLLATGWLPGGCLAQDHLAGRAEADLAAEILSISEKECDGNYRVARAIIVLMDQ
jgi:hypothetical protein